MKKKFLIGILILVLFSSFTQTFGQCACSEKYRDIKPFNELELADIVFIGEVIEIRKTKPDKRNRYTEIVEFKVGEIWKGELKKKFTIVNYIYGCVNGYSKNEKWLIYAYKNKNKTFSTGCCCSRTKPISKAKEDLEKFKEIGLKSLKALDLR